jgi:hypothetical protein
MSRGARRKERHPLLGAKAHHDIGLTEETSTLWQMENERDIGARKMRIRFWAAKQHHDIEDLTEETVDMDGRWKT